MNLHELIFGVHGFSETKKQTNYIVTHKVYMKSVEVTINY